jgi:hypothetical protein
VSHDVNETTLAMMRKLKKLMVASIAMLAMKTGSAQDSTTAVYIANIVGHIENSLAADIYETNDTMIYNAEDTMKREPLRVHTEYYINSRSGQVDKIIETTIYKTWNTKLTVYYQYGQPLRFTSLQKSKGEYTSDFDVYYKNDLPVYCVQRDDKKGKPDGTVFISWCYDLLKEFKARSSDGLQGRAR